MPDKVMLTRRGMPFPRRNCIDMWCEAERAIAAARDAVERAGADPRLTDAVILLNQAQEKAADWYEDGALGRAASVPDTPDAPRPVTLAICPECGDRFVRLGYCVSCAARGLEDFRTVYVAAYREVASRTPRPLDAAHEIALAAVYKLARTRAAAPTVGTPVPASGTGTIVPPGAVVVDPDDAIPDAVVRAALNEAEAIGLPIRFTEASFVIRAALRAWPKGDK